MLFNSFHFLVFFPIVFFLYFMLPAKGRSLFLLGASYYFYMAWEPTYALLIIASTVIDYIVGLKLPHSQNKKSLLCVSLFTNLGLLFTFKYFNFATQSVESLSSWFNNPLNLPSLDVLLPVGISFYTFQTLSYTIDIYRNRIRPTNNFLQFALYVSFFPQLVAGPIERASHLLPQLIKKHDFNYERAVQGMRQILWGFFKKLVIADHVSLYVDVVFSSPTEYGGLALLVGAYLFAFQIYCDFSGYSDIAIGCARILGIDLMENFKRPYFARSLTEFWRRWHISLSTWFRDYLYIPLGGNKVNQSRLYLNLFLVFIVSGLWHGANWTFVVWGAIHGLGVMFERVLNFSKLKDTWSPLDYIRAAVVFHIVVLAWVFFRAENLQSAITFLNFIFTSSTKFPESIEGFSSKFALQSILLMELVHFFQEKSKRERILGSRQSYVRWFCYLFLILLIFFYGKFDQQSFIYFQF